MKHFKNRTKKLLWHHLYKIITKEKIAFDLITVNQICDDANLHRTTFYKHFKDKYALLEFGYDLLAFERQQFTASKRLLEPFSISEQLEQSHYYHTAFELATTTPYLQQFFQKNMRKTIEADLYEFGVFPENIPENLIVSHISSTLSTLDYYWRTEANNLTASKIDTLFNQLISPYFPNDLALTK